MYYRKNPTAYYYNRFIENIYPFYFNSSGIFHSINLYSNKSNKEINRLFSIIGVQTFKYEFNFYKNPNININHKIKNLYNLGVGYITNHINLNPIILKTRDAYFLKMKKIINSYKFHLNEKLTTLFSEEESKL
jgi:hypothetical protein